ncbi:hypothetical protein KXQ82_12175 [Mucilaginibacter sp. HMF5004]|uniref:hypothetical protein n=1 Tax=Mucilaginibacter rivuli TaxID=2857527 RepID=UPI001C5D3993|nr:hypothetical protein [Mucilaginibacter rivuli]MBW4890483.1 hypothetical protein [Mucilaginibacter rivuli]
MKITLWSNIEVFVFRFLFANFVLVIFFQYIGLIYVAVIDIAILAYCSLKVRVRDIEITETNIIIGQKNTFGKLKKQVYSNNQIIFIYRQMPTYEKYRSRTPFSKNSILGNVLMVYCKNDCLFELTPGKDGMNDNKIIDIVKYLLQIGIKQEFEKFGDDDIKLPSPQDPPLGDPAESGR